MAERDVVEEDNYAGRQTALHKGIAGRRGTHHIRGEECRDDRNGHDNGVEEVADDAEGEAEGRYDERELTYLGHREAAFHGCLQRLSAEKIAERAEHGLSDEYCQDDCDDRQGIFNQYARLDKHAYRDEEDSSEEVLDRLDELYYLVRLDRFGQYAAHHEGSEGAAEAYLSGHDGHQTAQSERHDEQCLLVDELADIAQEHGNEEYSDDKP